MRFDGIFFDSGGTLYGSGTGPDASPAEVASKKTKRVHAVLDGMGVDLDFQRLEKALVRQEEVCRQRLRKAYNFHRLMVAVAEELHLPSSAWFRGRRMFG